MTRTVVTTPKGIMRGRLTLRAFGRLCEQQDPVALAEHVEYLDCTFVSLAAIRLWLKRYAAALRARQPQ